MIRVLMQQAPIDIAGELAAIEVVGTGAVASFTGLVRGDDGIETLELEHYPGMTEAALRALAEQAATRWQLLGVSVAHRVGPMRVGERIVFVGTAAPHRAAALEACAFLIDRLKTDAPFWKREVRGVDARWVDARDADGVAAGRWASPRSAPA